MTKWEILTFYEFINIRITLTTLFLVGTGEITRVETLKAEPGIYRAANGKVIDDRRPDTLVATGGEHI